MDKYELSIKEDKIRKHAENKDYETAAKIADTIDWSHVKNIKMLTLVSQIYEKTGSYSAAKEVLYMAYKRVPVGRRMLYKLTELSVKAGELRAAEHFFEQFQEIAPNDISKLILAYQIEAAKGEPVDKLITILELYRKNEFEEKWAYELALLYHKAGKGKKCVQLCNEIILWFSVGTYVDKAMQLKMQYEPLTPAEQEKMVNKEKFEERIKAVEREFAEKYENESAAIAQAVSEDDDSEEDEAPEETETASEEKDEVAVSMDSLTEVLAQAVADTENMIAEENAADEEAVRARFEAPETSAPEEAPAEEPAEESEELSEETSEDAEALSVASEFLSPDADLSATREFVKSVKAALAENAAAFDVPKTLEEVAAERKAEEAPAEEASAEEAPAEAAAEEIPAPEASEEETPVEETPVEETPVEETPAEETPAVLPELNEHEMAQMQNGLETTDMGQTREFLDEVTAALAANASVFTDEINNEVNNEVNNEANNEANVGAAAEPVAEAPAEAPAEETFAEETPAEEAPAEPETPAAEALAEETAPEEAEKNITCVVVEEADNEQRIAIAVEKLKKTHEILELPATKVAKISGAKLNVKGVGATMEKLAGRDLIIDYAADLSKEAAADLTAAIESPTETMVILLVDTADRINDFLIDNPELDSHCLYLADDNENYEDIPAAEPVKEEPEEEPDGRMTAEEFVECAYRFAEEEECVLDAGGKKALQSLAERLYASGAPMDELTVRNVLDDAIDKAEHRGLKGIFSSKYDKNGFLILKESFFV